MLGEQFDVPDCVMGVVLKLRPQFDKLDVWLNNADNQDAIKLIRANLLSIL